MVLMDGATNVLHIRGTNHAWSNRSDEPCLLCDRMIEATPR